VLLSVLIVCAFGPSVLLTWTALALLLWNVFRARHEIYAVYNSARRLDQSLARPKTRHNERDPTRDPEHQGLWRGELKWPR
jgi:hypothetical protein